MSTPENPERNQFVADSPFVSGLIETAIDQGHGRKQAAEFLLDIADDLERRSEEARRAALLVTDGIVEIEEVPTSDLSEQVIAVKTLSKEAKASSGRRIPLRAKELDVVHEPDLDKVYVTNEQLEAEVRDALSDDFIKSVANDAKQKLREHIVPSQEELEAEIASAWSGVLTEVSSSDEANEDDFRDWEGQFSVIQAVSQERSMPTDEEIAQDPVLRRRALFQIAKDDGKGLVGQVATVFADKVGIERVNDTLVAEEIDRSGAAVIDARARLAKGEDISDLRDKFKAVRNLERALRNPMSGMSIPVIDEAGQVTGGNYYSFEREIEEI